MSKEIIEKKVYPSQINTKTISARIPVQDYVKFLQESLQKNISLNDWLLIKIYSPTADIFIGNSDMQENNNDVIRIYKDFLSMHIGRQVYEFFKESFEGKDYLEFNKESICDMMNNLMINWQIAHQKRVASLQDVKTQLTVLIKDKFEDIEDQKEYRKDIFGLLKELE